jgi:DedD protein
MDEQVKRRLIGAGILSILAVIIVPYFFEDKAPKTATELPLPMESQSLALPKDESAAVEKPQPETQTPKAQQTPASKKRAYTTVPLDEPTAPTAVPSEDVAQAPVAEDYAEEPVSESRGPVILDPRAPQTKPSLTPKLQHPMADVPPAKVATDAADRPKPPTKKPEAIKPAKSTPPPVALAPDAPVKKPVAPPEAPKKAATPATAPVSKPPVSPASTGKPSAASSYLVQAGTFSDENNAKALVEKLKKRSLPVRMQVVEGLNGKVYRVTVGPNLDHARAEQIQKQLSEQDGVRGLILQGH